MRARGRPAGAWWLVVEAPAGADPACAEVVRAAVEGARSGAPLADPHLARVLAEAAARPFGMAAEATLSTATQVMTVRLLMRLPAGAGRALGIRREG